MDGSMTVLLMLVLTCFVPNSQDQGVFMICPLQILFVTQMKVVKASSSFLNVGTHAGFVFPIRVVMLVPSKSMIV